MSRRYHLGCGEQRLEGWINADIRATSATDLTLDLNDLSLEPGSAEAIFSHAFFEHLYRDRREAHLESALRALDPRAGALCYIGLPDFERIARAYLERGPGIVGKRFDLYEVYRYTHGDPEGADGWIEQLHKSLFDLEEVDTLLAAAGFPSYAIFSYVFRDEPVAINLGFYATARQRSERELRDGATALLAPFDGQFLMSGSIEYRLVRSRTPAEAKREQRRLKRARLSRRMASGASSRIARARERMGGTEPS